MNSEVFFCVFLFHKPGYYFDTLRRKRCIESTSWPQVTVVVSAYSENVSRYMYIYRGRLVVCSMQIQQRKEISLFWPHLNGVPTSSVARRVLSPLKCLTSRTRLGQNWFSAARAEVLSPGKRSFICTENWTFKLHRSYRLCNHITYFSSVNGR